MKEEREKTEVERRTQITEIKETSWWVPSRKTTRGETTSSV